METIQSFILGIIQGITEFLPISSTAHLVLVPWLFNWQDQGLPFNVALHFGSLFATVFYFRDDLKKITAELYLKQAIVYIHLNPVYHGFADEVNTWLYSSYKAICSTRPTLINKVDVLNLFEDIPNFKACHHMKAAESYVTRFEVDY